MASIERYLKELDRQRDKLANILVEKGVEADESETYNSLVAKVREIPTGGGGEPRSACISLEKMPIGKAGSATKEEM